MSATLLMAQTCDGDESPGAAPTRARHVFTAKQGLVSGSVKVITDSAARWSSYDWESSTDGGKTRVALPSTLQAHTVVIGLVPGSTAMFRRRAVTKTGVTDWSQPVAIIVK